MNLIPRWLRYFLFTENDPRRTHTPKVPDRSGWTPPAPMPPSPRPPREVQRVRPIVPQPAGYVSTARPSPSPMYLREQEDTTNMQLATALLYQRQTSPAYTAPPNAWEDPPATSTQPVFEFIDTGVSCAAPMQEPERTYDLRAVEAPAPSYDDSPAPAAYDPPAPSPAPDPSPSSD